MWCWRTAWINGLRSRRNDSDTKDSIKGNVDLGGSCAVIAGGAASTACNGSGRKAGTYKSGSAGGNLPVKHNGCACDQRHPHPSGGVYLWKYVFAAVQLCRRNAEHYCDAFAETKRAVPSSGCQRGGRYCP